MIFVDQLTVRFGAEGVLDRGENLALDGVSATIPAGRITGVFGRNGAGKTTLFRVLAGYLRPTSGDVTVHLGGEARTPYEDAVAMSETILARPMIPCSESESVRSQLSIVACTRPRWDGAEAERLLDRFEIPLRRRMSKLSTGKQAAVSAACALASGCPLTLFDEAHLGMDAPTRYAFYDEVLTTYSRGIELGAPRTFLLSTHLIDEIATIISDALIIDDGRVLVHDEADNLRRRGAEVTGDAEAVDEVTFGLRVLSSRALGRTKRVVVYDELNGSFVRRAADARVDIGPLPLQDLFVHLTAPPRHETEVQDPDREEAPS